ncbi:hypothetical protein [Bradyrhizobium sp. dw_78]|nr:hypothetical protein [Bradyrhizobium sp. dw_78]
MMIVSNLSIAAMQRRALAHDDAEDVDPAANGGPDAGDPIAGGAGSNQS